MGKKGRPKQREQQKQKFKVRNNKVYVENCQHNKIPDRWCQETRW